jgi:hypothetical protein
MQQKPTQPFPFFFCFKVNDGAEWALGKTHGLVFGFFKFLSPKFESPEPQQTQTKQICALQSDQLFCLVVIFVKRFFVVYSRHEL